MRSGKKAQKKAMKMGTSIFLKDKSNLFTKRLIPLTICSLLPITMLLLYFYHLPFSQAPKIEITNSKPIINITSHSASPPSSSYSGITKLNLYFFLDSLIIDFDIFFKLVRCSNVHESS